MRESGGYQVAAITPPSLHCRGVSVFYCKAEHFTLEALCLHVPNVARFHLAPGGKWWHVVGCYITLEGVLTTETVIAAISQRLCGAELLVASDFNANLAAPEGNTHE